MNSGDLSKGSLGRETEEEKEKWEMSFEFFFVFFFRKTDQGERESTGELRLDWEEEGMKMTYVGLITVSQSRSSNMKRPICDFEARIIKRTYD